MLLSRSWRPTYERRRKAEVTDVEEEAEDAEEGDIPRRQHGTVHDQYVLDDLYPDTPEEVNSKEWKTNMASEAINNFINDPDFTFAKVNSAWIAEKLTRYA